MFADDWHASYIGVGGFSEILMSMCAAVWLFFTVCFQMSSQIVTLLQVGCSETLMSMCAAVWLFCTVCFQMSSQIVTLDKLGVLKH